jgi:hypothetical protein
MRFPALSNTEWMVMPPLKLRIACRPAKSYL